TGGKSAAVHPEIGLTRGPGDRRGGGGTQTAPGGLKFGGNGGGRPRPTGKAPSRNRKTPPKQRKNGFGRVLLAVHKTGPTGAVRAARWHARCSKRGRTQPQCLAISTPSRNVTSKASSPACRSPRPRARAPALPPLREQRRRSRAAPTLRICA